MPDPTRMPDSDPAKRQGPDEVSGQPDNDVGGAGRPAGDPRRGKATTADPTSEPARPVFDHPEEQSGG